jgi:uncharacterized protein YgiM (DUF1202 family)
MRKPLLALSLVMVTSMGVSTGGVLAASPSGTVSRGISQVTVSASVAGSPVRAGSAASVSGAAVVEYALRFLGYPYTTVGNSPATGFSCIGFVSYVYRSLGINLPDDLGGAYGFAPQVAFSALLPGDVLYFQNTVWPGISHAAIYLGGGRFVHAEWYNRGVVTSSFTNDPVDGNYWTDHYLGANRPWAGATSSLPVPQSSVSTQSVASSPPAPPVVVAVPRVAARPVVRRIAGPSAAVRVLSLNVRVAPSLRSSVRTAVVRGTRLAIVGRRNGWYRVALRGVTTGWVVGAGIGKRGIAATARVVSHAHVVVHPRLRVLGSVTVVARALRVHVAPAVGARVIGSVGLRARLSVVGRSGGWDRVLLSRSRTGWVSGTYLSSAASHARTMVRRVTSQRGGATSRSTVALNVRQRPSLNAPVLSVLYAGKSYSRLGAWGGWVRVRLSSGSSGWVSGSLLGGGSSASTGVSTTQSAVSTVRASGAGPSVTTAVRLHARPSLSSAAIALVTPRMHLRILASGGGWTRVRISNGHTGYVVGSYVR